MNTIDSITSSVMLPGDVAMPRLGLGTWKSAEGDEVERAVRAALDLGYRHIDTAAIYGNEAGVGRAIRESGIDRDEIFITTKVWNDDQRLGPDAVRAALDTSLSKLGIERLDLWLVHWPVKGHWSDTWPVMEEALASGRVRAIGVSNFQVHHIEELVRSCQVRPMVNQVEFHPQLRQPELMACCREHGIVHEAWSPLMQGRIGEVADIVEIAGRLDRTPAQVVLRWNLQHGTVTIPKSVRAERLAENAAIFDFELTEADMATIDGLDRAERIGPHPDEITF
ncbi:MAG: aldo/keto reductase [Phycisphaerales bacterium]